MLNMFKVTNEDTRTASVDVVLVSWLLTLKASCILFGVFISNFEDIIACLHICSFLLWCFQCWVWTSKCLLTLQGKVSLVQTVYYVTFQALVDYGALEVLLALIKRDEPSFRVNGVWGLMVNQFYPFSNFWWETSCYCVFHI